MKGYTRFVLTLGTPLLLSLSAHAYSLQEGVDEVLQTHPAIQEKLEAYKATLQELKSSYAGYLPSLDWSSGVGQERTNSSSTGHVTKTFTIYEHSLTLSQNIFNGFGTMNQVAHQEARLLAASHMFIEKTDDTVFALVKAYSDVLKTRELVDIAKSNVKFNEEIFDKVSKLYTAGMTTLSEAEKADTSLSLSISNMIVAQNNLADAIYTLSRHIGRPLKVEELESFEFDPKLPHSLDEVITSALAHNPTLLVSSCNVKAAQELHKERKRKFLPRVDMMARENKNHNINGLAGDDNRFKATLTVSMNLFAGGADVAEYQKTSAQIAQEESSKLDLERQVKEQSELAWSSYTHLEKQLDHLYRYKKTSQKTLMLYQKEYDLGRRTLLDLLVAQNDYIAAQTQICKGEHDLLVAKFRILDAMGTMVTTLSAEKGVSHAKKVGLEPLKEFTPPAENGFKSLPPKSRQIEPEVTEVIGNITSPLAPKSL